MGYGQSKTHIIAATVHVMFGKYMLPKLNQFNPIFDSAFCGDYTELDSDDCYLETLIDNYHYR